MWIVPFIVEWLHCLQFLLLRKFASVSSQLIRIDYERQTVMRVQQVNLSDVMAFYSWLMKKFKELFDLQQPTTCRFARSPSFSHAFHCSLKEQFFSLAILVPHLHLLFRLGLFAKQLTFIDRNRRMACVRAWAHSRSTNNFYSMFVIASSTIDQGVTLDEIIMFEMKLSDKIAIW